ncbi:ABC transporter transmembrane domain-containing protein [Sulfurovum sp.]|uniref:ABC transporter ATP-binding protein n=1 Tax=Sulfurovum sp. TaxID=1969726 RepID=UPI0025D91916|nr:ABC transporter transmembrane domain-containing protein [Sulfurovum sp.]
MKDLFRYFFPYFKAYKKEFLFAVLGMIAVAAGTTGSAQLLKPVLDQVFINKDREMLALIPFAIVGVFLLKSVGKYVQTYYTIYIGNDIVRKIRNKLSLHLMYQDMAYLNKMRNGELLSRTTNDIARVQNVVSHLIPSVLLNALLIVSLTGYVIYESPKLAFYFLVVMPLALVPLQILAKRMKRYSTRSQESAADLTTRLTEIFNNIEIIKSNSSQTFEQQRFGDENMNFFELSMKQSKVNALVSPVLEFFGSIAIAVAIYIGANEVIDGYMTVGSFFAFVTALFMLYDPIKKFSNIHNQMQDALAATERIEELFSVTPAITSGKTVLEHIEKIDFKNVSLLYEEKPALRNVTLEAETGKVYALVGDSGAGKSSFINLLVRFYDASDGTLLINDRPIQSYTLASLHRKIAFVTQRIFIFQDTVAHNVAYGEKVDEERVKAALKKAFIWEFVAQLPEGINTRLDEFGTNLSGGQRQRIALARALYKDPDVLILDEATSALDNKSEKAIHAALEALKEEMITFIVAHRLSTIEHADVILVFKEGRIVDRGTYAELLEHSEEFGKLTNPKQS